MTTFLAATILLFLLGGIWMLLERNHHRTAGMPRSPFGVGHERDTDLWRVRHDLDVSRQTR